MRAAAFFDVDRTLVYPGSMERIFIPFLIKRRYLRAGDLARYLGFLTRNLGEAPGALARNNKYHFKDKDPGELERLAAECFQRRIRPRVSEAGRRAAAEHRRRGRLVVLLTGSLEPLAELLRRELGADLALAASLGVSGGVYSGLLGNRRPHGPEKARLARQLAQRHGLDLTRSYAYGDHLSDLEILSAVGNPRAVNPSPGLRREARRRGWPILSF
jgi:HAD superfamily hydrolase (TIGR01490 family)